MSYAGIFTDKNSADHPVASTLYGTCDTAANVAAKVVSCADFDTLLPGVSIRVKFANSNTANNPTININNTGAKALYLYGSTAAGADEYASWKAGAILSLTYNGTAWQIDGGTDAVSELNNSLNALGLSVADGKLCQTYNA